MWEKNFRIVTFAAIYEAIYWAHEEGNTHDSIDNHTTATQQQRSHIDIEAIAESYSITLNEEDIAKMLELVEKFQNKQDQLYSVLEQYTTAWNKTYDLVKAIMCTALIELEELSPTLSPEQKKLIVNKYVRIAQDMIGGNNPNLVFAIIGKIYGV